MNPVEKNYLKELLEYIGLDLRMDDKESEYSIICDAEGDCVRKGQGWRLSHQ